MQRVNGIPKEERCEHCAGFGFVYRAANNGTLIREVECKPCKRTGRRNGLTVAAAQQ